MKRVLSVILVCIMIATFTVSAFADDVSLYNNHTAVTSTDFVIYDNGEALVAFRYAGYEGITTGATIEIKIQKRNLLIFWNDVVNETITVNEVDYDDVYSYQLSDTGTYKCTVTYTVYGTAGEADVIPFERTVKYS
jgi:hypothetical protein